MGQLYRINNCGQAPVSSFGAERRGNKSFTARNHKLLINLPYWMYRPPQNRVQWRVSVFFLCSIVMETIPPPGQTRTIRWPHLTFPAMGCFPCRVDYIHTDASEKLQEQHGARRMGKLWRSIETSKRLTLFT